MIARTILTTALLVAASACERGPGWTLHGQAAVALAEDDDSEPEGLAGAQVTVRCDGKKPLVMTVTADEAGAFEFSGTGSGLPMDCAIQVVAEGREAVRMRVADVCADDDDDDVCEHGVVLAALR